MKRVLQASGLWWSHAASVMLGNQDPWLDVFPSRLYCAGRVFGIVTIVTVGIEQWSCTTIKISQKCKILPRFLSCCNVVNFISLHEISVPFSSDSAHLRLFPVSLGMASWQPSLSTLTMGAGGGKLTKSTALWCNSFFPVGLSSLHLPVVEIRYWNYSEIPAASCMCPCIPVNVWILGVQG